MNMFVITITLLIVLEHYLIFLILLITLFINVLKAPALCKGTKTLKNKTFPTDKIKQGSNVTSAKDS